MLDHTMDESTLKQYLADNPPTVVNLAIKPHFDALNDKEKKYAHFISRASFSGTRINLRQISVESEGIYDFIFALHRACGGKWHDLGAKCDVPKTEVDHFLNYAAQFLGNAGNFKSFGDSKFIPRTQAANIAKLAKASPEASKLYDSIKDGLYASQSTKGMHLGYPDQGHISTYYPDSPNIKREEIVEISNWLKDRRLMPENTRLRQTKSGDYELLVASAVKDPKVRDMKEDEYELDGALKGMKLHIVYGDHHVEMAKIADNLTEAKKHALNAAEESMLTDYITAFHDGSMEAHKNSQRHWIKDKGPMVETNIGFIETYRDPSGERGEWEGFAAMVNKERTRAFGKLVESAPAYIPKLPWPAAFEKDVFHAPDFTSLEVLSFASSGIPAGINIPNYDDVRQNEGFKNVSLGNVMSAKGPKERTTFIRDEDQDLFDKYRDEAFEVQVGLHELLGHGCGKLLQETEPGEFNFDHSNPPVSPVTGKPITSYYKPGETWRSVFGGMGPSYEECRAELVAMSLCPDYSILQIFGFGDGKEDINGKAGDILYVCYLQMARAGIVALEFWDPNARKWGQPHMQARFAILQAFLSAGEEFCKLRYTKDDLSDLEVYLDRNKIQSHGRPAVDDMLQKVAIYKSTADFAAGKELYERMTDVNDWYRDKVRPEILRQAKPRKVYVQANTFLDGDKVTLKEYEPTPVGMIQSFADRDYI